jgi:hypothetical protein
MHGYLDLPAEFLDPGRLHLVNETIDCYRHHVTTSEHILATTVAYSYIIVDPSIVSAIVMFAPIGCALN